MHIRHRLGDSQGVRNLLRQLTKTLADLDAKPTQATLETAATLSASS